MAELPHNSKHLESILSKDDWNSDDLFKKLEQDLPEQPLQHPAQQTMKKCAGMLCISLMLCAALSETFGQNLPAEVVAFKGDNGNFWSVINYGYRNNIESAKSSLDTFCQFLVSPASSGKIYIRTPQNKYLSRINRGGIDYIEPAKDTPDVYCEFQLFIQDCKMVLKADNGKYLSRIRRGSTDNIEAAKNQIDVFSQFEVLAYQSSVTNLGILELFLNNGLGTSFKADNGNFWSVVDQWGIKRIEAANSAMGPSAKFLMERGPAGMILLKTPQNKYLSRILRGNIDFIEAAKNPSDVFCQFTVSQTCKMVLQADNGKFLSRIRRGSDDNIEAAKLARDVFCKFIVVPYSG